MCCITFYNVFVRQLGIGIFSCKVKKTATKKEKKREKAAAKIIGENGQWKEQNNRLEQEYGEWLVRKPRMHPFWFYQCRKLEHLVKSKSNWREKKGRIKL